MAKGCVLSTGYLPRGGMHRNSVDRITDRPNMTSAVDRGRKASTQTNKQNSNLKTQYFVHCFNIKLMLFKNLQISKYLIRLVNNVQHIHMISNMLLIFILSRIVES